MLAEGAAPNGRLPPPARRRGGWSTIVQIEPPSVLFDLNHIPLVLHHALSLSLTRGRGDVMTPSTPELTVEGVLAWLRGLVPGLPAAQEARLAQRLAAVSEGVPLFLQFIVDDVRDRQARDEPIAAIMSALEALPAPFSAYAGQQLAAMREMQRQTAGAVDVDVARVFALLTLVKGALPLEELQQVLQT